MKKLLNIVKFLFILILILSFFLIYKNQDRFMQALKASMEASFSDMTSSNVSIESISGNPFRKIFFKGLSFDFGKYDFVFESASLEYSLLDIISGKTPKTGISETVMSLNRGSLVFNKNIILSNKIRGKIRLRPGTMLLDNINFELSGQLHNSLDGHITTKSGDRRVEISYEASPVFKEEEFIFKKIRALVTGPLDNLTLRGKIERKGIQDIHFRAYSIRDKDSINIGSRIGIETESANINHFLSIDAQIDAENNVFSAVFVPNTGRISAQGSYTSSGEIDAEFKNQQLKIFNQDFSNSVSLKAKAVFQGNVLSHLLADISTGASVVNYRPVSEIDASLRLDAKRLRAVYIKIGDTTSMSGFFDIRPPRKLELSLNFVNFILQDLLDVLTEKRPDISGRVSGKLNIQGVLPDPKIEIKTTAYDGHLGQINYERLIVNADGVWPHLRIYDSRITHKESSLMLDGELDMGKMGSEKFMEDVIITSADNTIVWEGWDITRGAGGKEFLLQRALSSGFRVGYKAHMTDETRYDPSKKKNELNLEYDFTDDSVFEFRTQDSEEFFGVRKKYKF
jgi:hypothetical protein